MRIGSLFSGIGGLELGLEMSGVGETVWQVEQSPLCLAVLEKHWPSVERFNDVCTVGAHNLPRVDLVCGGFPCQDVSSAGKRAGLAGSRSGLWYQFARVVTELRPEWVVVENVASGAALWVDFVCGDLEQLGYASLQVPIAAEDVGASHPRARVFVVAHTDNFGKHARAVDAEVASAPPVVADAHRAELRDEPGRRGRPHRTSAEEPSWAGGGFVEPNMVRVVHGVSRGLDTPSRRIATLGNSVVPQCAEVVGHVIQQLRGATRPT
jgi:DNA (cytosine-5)-methyltransferase 1